MRMQATAVALQSGVPTTLQHPTVNTSMNVPMNSAAYGASISMAATCSSISGWYVKW
eukprot:CAMPEP_0179330464 /NCGR_PEP_ID=MMETSP0797-20121207/63678_1 /TAXON_ID=47934 /ORGANISM="Dinophysis acuminata, Strain DAEP01" /LENGTH=56 /DNA_ID=CAMNT_0021043195 /DNA_START=91 /DNA_END=261 /DNA_ORIENTATION=-